MIFGYRGGHKAEVDDSVLRRRSRSSNSLVSKMAFGVIRLTQAKELKLVLVELLFTK